MDRKARARAWAAEIDAARRRAGLVVPDGIAAAAGRTREQLSQWLFAEVAPGRLVPWLPVAFGFGIVFYFAAEREPAWWATGALVFGALAMAVAARKRPVGFPVALAFAAIAVGFAVGTSRGVYVAHPVLQYPAGASISGFIARDTRSGPRRRTKRHGAAGGHIRRVQCAPESAAVSVAPGRL
jgi:competence protein ComEC